MASLQLRIASLYGRDPYARAGGTPMDEQPLYDAAMAGAAGRMRRLRDLAAAS